MGNAQLEKYRRIAKKLKNPTPVELPSGKFRCQVTVNGRRESVIDEDPRVARAEALAIKSSVIASTKAPGSKSVSSAIDDYISSKSAVLSPSTIGGYRAIQRTRFQEAMSQNIFSITEREWQEYCNAEAALCSAKTLKNSWMFLSTVIYKTTKQRFEISLPPIPKNPRPYLDHDQILIFVKAIKGTSFEIPALLALCSLRRSEILGLRWKHIDTETGIITVSGAAVVGEDHKLVHKNTTKNATSSRNVPILIPRLKEAIEESPRDADALVVTGNQNQLWAQINGVCESLGLPKVGVHGLRHSFASLAYYLGIPEKVAMAIGGWADSKTMHAIYTHIAEKDINQKVADIQSYYSSNGASVEDTLIAQKDAEIIALKKQLETMEKRLAILDQLQAQFTSLISGTS